MEVTQRRNIVGNIENLKQTSKANGSANGQVNNRDRLHPDRKLNAREITSIAKRYLKILSYPIECIVCAIAIFYIVLILSPLLLVYNVLRFIEKQWVYLRSGWVAMSGQDALWLQDTKENRLIINSAMALECTNIEHLVDGVREIVQRCIKMKKPNGQAVFPRLNKCIQRGIFQYFLKDPDSLDIADHIYAYSGPAPKSHEEMESLISTLSAKDFTFESPPWQFIIIPKTYDRNEAIILFRLHHGMADGVSLTRFLLEQFPDKPLPENKLLKYSAVNRKWIYLNGLLAGSRILVEKLFSTPDCSIIHGPPLKGVKKMSWSQPISLQVIKKIKNHTGTTVNDIMMACVSMSFHDYFRAHGVSNPPDVTITVPVDVRPKGQPLELENNFAVVTLKLPVSEEGALENLYATKRHMDEIKHSGEAFVLAIAGNLTVEYIPEFLTKLWNVPIANKHSFVMSNVPGSQEQFSICGHKVTQIFFAPPQRNLVGIGVGIYSYAGEFSIGVQSDLNCMTDPKWIVKAFESRLAQLEKCIVSSTGQIEFDSGIE
ncbi:uncharacterized protein LOC114522161 [Dendronephthya gigantea]|uniref:uncharacterized protein LOC114522161 n=1 Tax=Dendronephthya gigantea TaxID=151771 RepID=UPI001068FFB9|nr:uncharacterized protein LOC114522161 [Dendronephthya gigantea]